MRVVLIGPFGLHPKGTMRVRALPLARALAAEGHEVRVLMPPWHTPAQAGATWQEGPLAIEYVSLAPRAPGLSEVAASWRLARRALAWAPDVIHCFKPKGHAGLAAWLLWRLRRVRGRGPRLVVDEDDWEGAGGWNELEPYAPWLKRFFAWQERWGVRHSDAVTVASRSLETLVWAQGVRPGAVYYLPNGAALGHRGSGAQVRERYGLGDAPVMLLYTRLFEFDPARAVEVFRLVAQAEPTARLLVVGQALFAQDQARLTEALNAAGLAARAVQAGWVPLEDLPDYMAAADLALHLMDDTLVNRCKCSVKLADLLACGVPVVADAVGQSAEYIRHQETGLLVPPGRAEAMAAAVLALLRDPERRRAMGRAAADEFAQRFGWAALAQQALRAYRGEAPGGLSDRRRR